MWANLLRFSNDILRSVEFRDQTLSSKNSLFLALAGLEGRTSAPINKGQVIAPGPQEVSWMRTGGLY